jgi:hypothetical protein
MQEYSDQDMAPHARAAEPRIFYGWWVAVAFSLIIFLSTGIRFAVEPFLKPVVSDLVFDVSGGYGFAFAIACGLLLVGAGLSLTIDVNERPVRRELQPVAGGR